MYHLQHRNRTRPQLLERIATVDRDWIWDMDTEPYEPPQTAGINWPVLGVLVLGMVLFFAGYAAVCQAFGWWR